MKLNDFLDALVEDFQIGLMIIVGDRIYTINNDDLYNLQDSWVDGLITTDVVDGLITTDVVDRRKELRGMDLTVKAIHSAWFKENFVVIETKNK